MSTMAFVILGLLLLRPMSLYDLVRAFEAGVSLFYSASSGSLKRALDGLLREGHVEVEDATGGRGRKVYHVTPAGLESFRTWMTSELTGGGTETAALSRLFFLGLLEPAERSTVSEHIEARIRTDLARLEELSALVDQQDIPDELADVARYQRQTLDYGLATTRFALDWFRTRDA
ncbi:PadR family transcriptional regulator [Ornithinimicrobium panacihumi]|uniref:PadR family transcriptional regulator n=1 Tax=Ornithinimicrobium panacihumi TaxID=2008449 RepID=UPI003F89B3B6